MSKKSSKRISEKQEEVHQNITFVNYCHDLLNLFGLEKLKQFTPNQFHDVLRHMFREMTIKLNADSKKEPNSTTNRDIRTLE
jgi:hypothetical protein